MDPELQNAVIRVEKMMKDMVENDIEPDLHSFMVRPPGMSCRFLCLNHRPVSVYRFPRRALMLCRQLCMGIQSGARFPARSADAVPATLHGHFTQVIYRNRPIDCVPVHYAVCAAIDCVPVLVHYAVWSLLRAP